MWWFAVADALGCTAWAPPAQLLPIEHPELTESSGLAASRLIRDAVWTHDDSGPAVLFRFTLDGTLTLHEVPDASNEDWEDLAAAPCRGGGSCLYIADTGIGRDLPGEMEVYVAREPRGDGPATLVEVWNLTWPDAAHDAESLIVHPCTRDAWIFTKARPAEVYRIPANRGLRRRPVERVATLAVDALLTGADFSPDGTQIVLRSNEAAWVLPFDVDDPDAHWSDRPTEVATLPRGEGVAWDVDGDLLFTDEGLPTPLARMACLEPSPEAVCARSCGCGHAGAGLTGWLWLPALLWRRLRGARAPAAAAGSATA